MSPRTRAILIAPLLALDCIANMAHGGSIRHTLSGESWRNRDHKWWGWTSGAIDKLWAAFGGDPNHTEGAAAKEAKYGSIWGAWRADLKKKD